MKYCINISLILIIGICIQSCQPVEDYSVERQNRLNGSITILDCSYPDNVLAYFNDLAGEDVLGIMAANDSISNVEAFVTSNMDFFGEDVLIFDTWEDMEDLLSHWRTLNPEELQVECQDRNFHNSLIENRIKVQSFLNSLLEAYRVDEDERIYDDIAMNIDNIIVDSLIEQGYAYFEEDEIDDTLKFRYPGEQITMRSLLNGKRKMVVQKFVVAQADNDFVIFPLASLLDRFNFFFITDWDFTDDSEAAFRKRMFMYDTSEYELELRGRYIAWLESQGLLFEESSYHISKYGETSNGQYCMDLRVDVDYCRIRTNTGLKQFNQQHRVTLTNYKKVWFVYLPWWPFYTEGHVSYSYVDGYTNPYVDDGGDVVDIYVEISEDIKRKTYTQQHENSRIVDIPEYRHAENWDVYLSNNRVVIHIPN